jgi:hypothetical protein
MVAQYLFFLILTVNVSKFLPPFETVPYDLQPNLGGVAFLRLLCFFLIIGNHITQLADVRGDFMVVHTDGKYAATSVNIQEKS